MDGFVTSSDVALTGDLMKNLFLGTVWSGVGTAIELGKLGYGYATDPKTRETVGANAKKFSDNFGKYSSNGRDWAFQDFRGNPAIDSRLPLLDPPSQPQNVSNLSNSMGLSFELTNRSLLGLDYDTFMRDARSTFNRRSSSPQPMPDRPNASDPYTQQMQQLEQARQARDASGRWNIPAETGFEDSADNFRDDYFRRKADQSLYKNREQRDNESDDEQRSNKSMSKTVINSSRPSDYAPKEKLISDYENFNQRTQAQNFQSRIQAETQRFGINVNADVARENNQLRSSDNRYQTDVNAGVNRELGYAKTYAELKANLDRNRVTRDIGFDSNAKNLEASRFKTTTDAATDRFKWTTLNPTSIAEAQIKAGTYGMSQNYLSQRALEDNARKVNNEYNDRMMQYGRYQMEIANFQNNIANNQRAYLDQRSDRSTDRAQAMARFNSEMSFKIADRDRYYADLAEQRRQQRDDFNLRSQQIMNQIDLANRDFSLRAQDLANRTNESAARVNQINTDSRLKDAQFSATRADIGYNRNYQQQRSLAF